MNSAHDHTIIPENARRCVWMTAGILSYQLCDKNFDCDSCPLDQAMRTHFARQHGPELHHHTGTNTTINSPGGMGKEYSYSRDHCWVRSSGENIVSVGIEPRFALLLDSPKEIVLPSVDEHVQRGHFCSWIVLEGGVMPLVSPVSGIVVKTNTLLSNDPQLLNKHSLADGWLFELAPDNGELGSASLMPREKAFEQYETDFSLFNTSLHAIIKDNRANIGETLHDGGQQLHTLSSMLGAKKYFQVLSDVFTSKGNR